MDLHTLIDGIELTRLGSAAGSDDLRSIRVCDLTEDSRTAMPGSLFVARAGTKEQGAKFIDEAVHAGAVAVLTDNPEAAIPTGSHAALLYSPNASGIGAILAERFYGHPSKALAIAGVTGTNGKTTIAHLTQQIIKHFMMPNSKHRIKCGLIGTVVIDDGQERSVASMTTPPAIELSRTLATMVEHGCQACVMEVSSHALDQGRTSAVEIDAAGFTNLTGDHLDYHKTLESYTDAKAKLFNNLAEGSSALINMDDPAGQTMMDACNAGVQVLGCSVLNRDAAWNGEIVNRTMEGMQVSITGPIGVIESCVPFFGDYNASNVVISLGLADVLLARVGVDPETRIAGYIRALPTLHLPSGRLQRVSNDRDDLSVFVDFAHSDDSIRSSLGAVRRVLPEGASLWCVFGCGGDRDRTKRPRMGQAACNGADRIVLTSDNPRSEKPSRIVDDVLAGLDQSQRARVEVQVNRDQAIQYAIEHANAGDAIVIAGKGHEAQQILSDHLGNPVVHHFDDAEHAAKALHERRSRSEASA